MKKMLTTIAVLVPFMYAGATLAAESKKTVILIATDYTVKGDQIVKSDHVASKILEGGSEADVKASLEKLKKTGTMFGMFGGGGQQQGPGLFGSLAGMVGGMADNMTSPLTSMLGGMMGGGQQQAPQQPQVVYMQAPQQQGYAQQPMQQQPVAAY